ncbi:hypothetical protein [Curvibacter sp. PAE-UM]|uniref:hypothetical protein n=1 Tax=Curvibacter sp. PAE-UM TaxID=1714344 RepID=UPI0012E36798|nr:hypothetical protein [Curvibacter sp. PAE-UM]
MFERSEFARTPLRPSNAAYRRSRATNPARLFFGDFLLAKQKKVTALPGAHPGNATSKEKNREN